MIQFRGLEIEPVIGLEVHVQLATRTKLWCGCALAFGDPPNSHVCPVCLGLPGALPVINGRAVEFAVRVGAALNCRIAQRSKWDRKSYFYPDLPKNYQISQYDLPLCECGYFEFPHDSRIRKIRIRRAHLEEDAGKNVHDFPGYTGVDLNRAGTPLLEIVTEPDFRSAEEVREFAVQLQRVVRYLGVSEANMQKGQMRFEPNINVRIAAAGGAVATPIVEVKNLNSFRSLHGAVEFEIGRQVDAWRENGATAVAGNKSNRGWDDVREVTVPQREKEEAHDYRYFPDPDLVPVTLDAGWIHEIREHMPELPIPRTERFISEYKLPQQDAPSVVDCRATADLLDHAAEAGGEKITLGKHILSFWARHANERNTSVAGLGVPARRLAELANLVVAGRISATSAALIAERIVAQLDAALDGVPRPALGDCGGAFPSIETDAIDPAALAEALGLIQISDAGQIDGWIARAFADNEKAVRDALGNPKKMDRARGFLVGQVMKLSAGRADPKLAGEKVAARLAEEARRTEPA